MKIKYQADLPNLSDVCLFSSFSFAGKVEEYVYYYLSELKKAKLSIVFISTSILKEECVNKLSQYASLIIERENKCPDFGSWQAALSLLNWGKNLNSILLVNDSVFGPFFDLDNIISSMKNRFDVWGMTDSYEIEYHIQSYFIYFNKEAIESNVFSRFWKKVDLTASKEEVIQKYEIGLSSQFLKNNYSIGAYASIDVLNRNSFHGHTVINPTLVFWKTLIKTHQFPFLKRELIIKQNISKTYWNVGLYINVSNWKQTLEKNTSYPIAYIDDFINNYYKTIKVVNRDIILRKRKLLFLTNNAEAGDPQLILMNFLKWLKEKEDVDIEILICNEGADDLKTGFDELGSVTNFYTTTAQERVVLKERWVDEVAFVFSNTLENLEVQKFLSFMDVPQVVFIHELVSGLRDKLFYENNIRWAKDNISKFITTTNLAREKILEYIDTDEQNVELIYPFVSPFEASEFAAEAEQIKLNMEIPPGAFIVGMYGKFVWENSADLLPMIAANLCRENNNIHIIWLGADKDDALYRSINFDLDRIGLAKRIRLVGKKVDTRPYFAAFDVFASFSREDLFSLANLESGLAGKPFICFENSGISAEYTDFGLGKKVSYLDITGLTEKIFDYYDNRSRLENEKALIQQIVKDNFITAVQAPKLMRAINTYYDHKELRITEDPQVTFMTHIYYDNSWAEIKSKLKYFDNGRNYFLFSISEVCLIKEELIEDIKQSFKNSFYLITSNIGKDIGGKLALIDLYLLLDINSSYIVLLHDKLSPHSIQGKSWRNELFKIIDAGNYSQILALLKDPSTGIVGAKEHIVNEYDRTTGVFYNNNQLSKKLLQQFNISIDNYDFLGGSMYWLRSSIVEKFFKKNHPILMRENLEAGNVLDLYEEKLAHTWERVFSWIVTNEGYKIKGI